MKTKYRVVGRDGKVYTRSSDRTYTHCIVRHWEAYSFENAWHVTVHVPAGSAAISWCGRPDLVQARVREIQGRQHTSDVEVIAVG